MDFTILFQRFVEQSPLIVLCGLIILQLLKMYKEEKKLVIKERKERTKELKEVNEKHAEELKILNDYIRGRDMETLGSLEDLTSAIVEIKNAIETKL